jgi:hypothetical protein
VTMATSQMEYNFRKGRTDTVPGILIINRRFEFIINRANREKTTFWYYCKYRKTKGVQCSAKATVVKLNEDKYILKANDDEHGHPGSPSKVIAEDIKLEMCSLVELTPENPVAEARKTVILKNAEKYSDNQDLWAEVVEKIGDYDALDKRLLRARQKIIGKAPMNRDEFDPGMVLADNDDVLVLDSNNLPEGWKEKIDEQSELSVMTDLAEDHEHGDEEESAGNDSELAGDNGERILPKMVLVFTTKKLL